MQRPSVLLSGALVLLACGGRIQQGVDTSPADDNHGTATSCGIKTCGSSEQCCVGGPLLQHGEGYSYDPNLSLESCVPSGSCNLGMVQACGPGVKWCGEGDSCCLHQDPSGRVVADCQESCGGEDEQPAVVFCRTNQDCPTGFDCIPAAIGSTGANEAAVCGGRR